MSGTVTFDHGDVTVVVPAAKLHELISRAIADRHVILWAGINVSDDDGLHKAADWFLGALEDLMLQAGCAALDRNSGVQLRIAGSGREASTN